MTERADSPASPAGRATTGRGAPLAQALLALLLFTLVGVCVHHRSFVGGEVLSTSGFLVKKGPYPEAWATELPFDKGLQNDQLRAFEPWMEFAARHWREDGRLPFWKDDSFLGAPLLGNGQSALFFPPHTLAILLGNPKWTQAALALFKLVLASFSTYLLARHLGTSFAGGLVAGLTFGFFGFQVTFSLFPLTTVSSFLPLLVLAADRALSRPSLGRVSALALVCCAQHLAGHPETVFHSQSLAGALVVLRALFGRFDGAPGRLLRLGLVTSGFVLGAALAAAQVLPLVEYILHSDVLASRGEIRRPLSVERWPRESAVFVAWLALGGVALRWLMRARRATFGPTLLLGIAVAGGLWTGLSANLAEDFLAPISADWLGSQNRQRAESYYIVTASGYWGGALALAVLGVLCGAPRRAMRVAAVVFGFFLLLPLRAPVIEDLLRVLPVFDVAENARLVAMSGLAMAILAGAGLDALRAPADDPLRHWRFAGAVLAPTAAALLVLAVGTIEGRMGVGLGPAKPADVPALEARLTDLSVSGDSLLVEGELESVKRPEKAWLLFGSGQRLPLLLTTVTAPDGADARTPRIRRFQRGLKRNQIPSFNARFRVLIELPKGKRRISGPLVLPADPALHLTSFPVLPKQGRARLQIGLFLAIALVAFLALRAGPRVTVLARGLLVLSVLANVFAFAYRYNPTVPRDRHFPPSPLFDFLRTVRPDGRVVFVNRMYLIESVLHYGVPIPVGYDGMTPARSAALLRIALGKGQHSRVPTLPDVPDFDLRSAGILGVRYIVDYAGSEPCERVPYEGEAGIRRHPVFENPHFLPRARLVTGARVVKNKRWASRLLRSKKFDPAREILLDAGEARPIADGDPGTARIVLATPDRVEVEVAPAAPAFLVLSDSHFPGWTAEVDGEERPIARANVALRAVEVRPGESRVVFTYRPLSFRAGFAISAATALLLAALGLRRIRARRALAPGAADA